MIWGKKKIAKGIESSTILLKKSLKRVGSFFFSFFFERFNKNMLVFVGRGWSSKECVATEIVNVLVKKAKSVTE